jgi:hypothetical protein
LDQGGGRRGGGEGEEEGRGRGKGAKITVYCFRLPINTVSTFHLGSSFKAFRGVVAFYQLKAPPF